MERNTAVDMKLKVVVVPVSDVDRAKRLVRAQLADRGVDVSDVFHDTGEVFHRAGLEGRAPGPDPQQRSYSSFASFSDPDGNEWVLQEITTRLPGR